MVLSDTKGDTWTSGCGTKSSCLDIHLCNQPAKVKSVEETYGEFWEDNVLQELCHIEDPNELANRLTCILNVMLDAKWPVVTFKVKPQYAPYVTQKLRDMRNVKIRLWKEYRKTGNVQTYQKMRTISKKLRNSTSRAAKRWFGRKMSDYKDSEKLWEFSKNCANWKQDSTPSAVIIDGVRITDPKPVADAVNNQLIQKVKDILAGIPDTGEDPLEYTRRWLADKTVPTVELTEKVEHDEVLEAMASLNITDAAGHDQLTTRLIKRMRFLLACPMTKLINHCFKYDIMPTVWKLAKISPLFKSGDKFDPKNYRPVAILPAMEKRSVTTAMLQLYDEILVNQDKGKDSACVFLYCSAAFDTVQHTVLLGKLYGASEKSLRWFKSYLSDRAQYVSIGGVPSEVRKIVDRTFQGSIGGPWCFLIMINDIVIIGTKEGVTVYIYANDTALRVTLSGNIEEDQRKLDKLMKTVVKYMQVTKLKFNFKKTEFVVCSPKRHEDYSRLVLNMDGNVVRQQLHARLLGLQISWDLTHTWYVAEMKNSLIASLNQRLFILNKLKNMCPKKCVKNLAHSLIYSKLCFGIQYYTYPLPENIWNQLVVILNKAARAVLKVRTLDMHVLDLYRVLNWLPANACRDYHCLNLFWSIKMWQKPRNLSKMFESETETRFKEVDGESHRMETRSISQNSIRRTQDNDSRGMRVGSFVPRMIKVFNNLDIEYKHLPSIPGPNGPGTDQERFLILMCQWKQLCFPGNWPENMEDALLDRAEEIYGLGINSGTSSTEQEVGVMRGIYCS